MTEFSLVPKHITENLDGISWLLVTWTFTNIFT